jgi:hypothetical protein
MADGRWGFHQGCCAERSGKANPAIIAGPLDVAACGRVWAPSSSWKEFTELPDLAKRAVQDYGYLVSDLVAGNEG